MERVDCAGGHRLKTTVQVVLDPTQCRVDQFPFDPINGAVTHTRRMTDGLCSPPSMP